MATQRQIEANRRNAQLSTGPRTAGGKAHSRWNAFRHGARGRVLLPVEPPAEYHRYRRRLLRDLSPRTWMQRSTAERLILQCWRLEMVSLMEARLLDRDKAEAGALMAAETGAKARPGDAPEGGISESAALGQVLRRTLSGPGSPYLILGRLEASLDRSYRRLWAEYRQLQAAARGARPPTRSVSSGGNRRPR